MPGFTIMMQLTWIWHNDQNGIRTVFHKLWNDAWKNWNPMYFISQQNFHSWAKQVNLNISMNWFYLMS